MSQSFILPFKFQHPSRNMCDESRKMESELIIKNIDRKVKMLGTITLRLRASGFTRLAWPNISFGKRGDWSRLNPVGQPHKTINKHVLF